ncbi:hypothetical protein NC653_033269 [Populus alba x Populus x berolinensis]|uniref:Uncharacterized protein n=1 Tax=Populus alba x Populus x berolinensis TaxID=444605 RepID=A0AAD6PYX8_9ROSI|nr:hypothetical protein NC653_033269 [Populus alba x Populus x berolinensis]
MSTPSISSSTTTPVSTCPPAVVSGSPPPPFNAKLRHNLLLATSHLIQCPRTRTPLRHHLLMLLNFIRRQCMVTIQRLRHRTLYFRTFHTIIMTLHHRLLLS